MPRGIKLFTALGIRVSIDYTWFIVFSLFAWSLAYGYYPDRLPGLGSTQYMLLGVFSALMLFACVLGHELAHSYVSNRLGLTISEITLFIFGGAAMLTKEPEKAVDELKIALAGPASSFALAGLFYLFGLLAEEAFPIKAVIEVFSYIVTVNLMLAIFNMIPGMPLDGGRVLKAIWWLKTNDAEKATRVASEIGRGFAMFLMAVGALQMWRGNFAGGLWSVLIGFFLSQAASGSYRQAVVQKKLGGLLVSDVMTREVVTVEPGMTLGRVVNDFLLCHHFMSYPVVDGRIYLGMLSLRGLKDADRSEWGQKTAGDVMEPASPDGALDPDVPAIDALSTMTLSGAGRMPVVKGGELVGIVSVRDIMKTLEFKRELGI
jgi:Zn-dependent protease